MDRFIPIGGMTVVRIVVVGVELSHGVPKDERRVRAAINHVMAHLCWVNENHGTEFCAELVPSSPSLQFHPTHISSTHNCCSLLFAYDLVCE